METRSLSDLLVGTDAVGVGDVEVTGLEFDSRAVSAGEAFFCVVGEHSDGHDYAAQAVDNGAVALVVERPLDIGVPQFVTSDTRIALAYAAAMFFRQPSRSMDIVGITGTNGKTTTTFLLDWIVRSAGRTSGVIGTVETRFGDVAVASVRTTPESLRLQGLLARMRDVGTSTVSMEVSSHAIALHRVDAVEFAVAAFTNLSQDHLDFHPTLADYFDAKVRLFTELPARERIICIDDEYGRALQIRCCEAGRSFVTVSSEHPADLWVDGVSFTASGSRFTMREGEDSVAVALPLVGPFNVQNAVVAAGCARALGIDLAAIALALENAPQVPGRLESVPGAMGFNVLVDYAHTPDSLAKAIDAVADVTDGRVIAVFGCGGDRDHTKRPLMGEAALRADLAVLTSDNPRTEDPEAIIAEVLTGMESGADRTRVCVDRREAIAEAISLARPGDSIIIAGKGHEDYQILADRTIDFDDRVVAREELEKLC